MVCVSAITGTDKNKNTDVDNMCFISPPTQNFIDDVIIKLLGKGNEEKNIVPIEHSMGIWFYFFFLVSVLN